jgi:hypothetical protein
LLYGVDDEEDDGEKSDEEGSCGGSTACSLSPKFIDGHTVDVKSAQFRFQVMESKSKTYVVEIRESRSLMP